MRTCLPSCACAFHGKGGQECPPSFLRQQGLAVRRGDLIVPLFVFTSTEDATGCRDSLDLSEPEGGREIDAVLVVGTGAELGTNAEAHADGIVDLVVGSQTDEPQVIGQAFRPGLHLAVARGKAGGDGLRVLTESGACLLYTSPSPRDS